MGPAQAEHVRFMNYMIQTIIVMPFVHFVYYDIKLTKMNK